ncbi:hypothetical protein GHNINEIG_01514 [Hydrogenovibrio crunogenus]|uniref:Uncharacterized protein n=1 Tax=Hydrogenovibrio crunogenus TaxID=39765 RepID=A0A4P7P0M2_9GAMM|nr:hypothetical protein [Hydrogenovibrio crunogenus]QBZ83459.1 hypothetical protein GHNINEIG_01514 [Hydrogenovibrio crunogenus]
MVSNDYLTLLDLMHPSSVLVFLFITLMVYLIFKVSTLLLKFLLVLGVIVLLIVILSPETIDYLKTLPVN